MDNKNLEIKSDDVQEILGTPPSWLVQWGTVLMALVLLGLTLVFWKLEYPDEVRGDLVLRSTNPPKTILANTDGMVENLFVKAGQKVERGDELLVMNSLAKYEDIISLSEFIVEMGLMKSSELNKVSLPRDLELGIIQESFAELRLQLNKYQFSNRQSTNYERITQVKEQIGKIENEIELTIKRKNNSIEQQKLRIDRQKLLKKKYPKESTLEDLKSARADVVSVENEIEGYKGEISFKKREKVELEFLISEIRNNSSFSNNEQLGLIKQTIDQIEQEIFNWKKTYILKSSEGGSIILKNFFDSQNYYKKGSPIIAINLEQDEQIKAYATIPVENTDKVKKGQKAHLHLTVFSSVDYGYLTGTVINKKTQYQEGNCLVEIQLDNGMTSSKGEDLLFEPNMIGQVEIITEDRNVLERLFGKASQLLF